MGFYDLPEAQRLRLIRETIAERRTFTERWSTLTDAVAAGWAQRARCAAALLSDCRSVADIGCGTMQLEPFLRPGTRYLPIDVVARDERTIVVDLNQQTLPALDVEGWAALGLLEHLFDVPSLFRQISGIAVVSYNPVDLPSRSRMLHTWVNDYCTSALESVFAQEGWAIVACETLAPERIWKLAR